MSEEVIGDDRVDSVDKSNDVVSHETYKRLLAQRKADQEKMRSLEEKAKTLSVLEEEKAKLAEEKLKADGNWKALLDAREAKIQELSEKYNSVTQEKSRYEQQFVEATKLQAFNDTLGGKLKHREYYNLVDTSAIALDPETGAIDKESLKKYADKFLKEHKELVAFSKPQIDSRAPKSVGTQKAGVDKMTPDELREYIKQQALAGKI